MAQLIVLTVGIYFIATGSFTVGLLVSYLAYATNFYNPLRQLAALWTNFQLAMAGADRISHILNMESNMPVIPIPVRYKTMHWQNSGTYILDTKTERKYCII